MGAMDPNTGVAAMQNADIEFKNIRTELDVALKHLESESSNIITQSNSEMKRPW